MAEIDQNGNVQLNREEFERHLVSINAQFLYDEACGLFADDPGYMPKDYYHGFV